MSGCCAGDPSLDNPFISNMPSASMTGFADRLDTFFRITERGSDVRTELKGGLITFLAMFYILAANPGIISTAIGIEFYGQLVAATALSACIACILMGIYARFPVALAPGMGINAFIAFTIVGAMGFTYEQALAAVFISGVLFMAVTVTGLRNRILTSIPPVLKFSISAGIGFFIIVVALFNAGIIVHGSGSALTMGDLASPGVLLAIFSIVVTLVLWLKGKWSAVLVGALSAVAVGYAGGQLLGWDTVVNGASLIPGVGTAAVGDVMTLPDFGLFGDVFTGLSGFGLGMIPAFAASIISLLVVDVFDTTGTLVAVGSQAGMIREDGSIVGGDRAMQVDAASSLVGAVSGTTTVTAFIESNVGIAAGARTGLMAVVVGLMFGLALFLTPLLSVITSACIAGALVLVGLLMASAVREIDWSRLENSIAAALTVFMTGLSGSITDGIAMGFLGYILVMWVSGRRSEVSITVRVLGCVFLGYFLLNYWIIPRLRICVVRLRIFLLKGGCGQDAQRQLRNRCDRHRHQRRLRVDAFDNGAIGKARCTDAAGAVCRPSRERGHGGERTDRGDGKHRRGEPGAEAPRPRGLARSPLPPGRSSCLSASSPPTSEPSLPRRPGRSSRPPGRRCPGASHRTAGPSPACRRSRSGSSC